MKPLVALRPAAQVGVSYKLDQNWSLNASVALPKMKSTSPAIRLARTSTRPGSVGFARRNGRRRRAIICSMRFVASA